MFEPLSFTFFIMLFEIGLFAALLTYTYIDNTRPVASTFVYMALFAMIGILIWTRYG